MQALDKEFLKFFFANFFAEGSQAGLRQSLFFFIFSRKFFVEGLDHSPRQRPPFYFF